MDRPNPLDMQPPLPPFTRAKNIAVVMPTVFEGLNEMEVKRVKKLPDLLNDSRAALERELGAPFYFGEVDNAEEARWLIGPASCNPALAALRPPAASPELFLDRLRHLLICDAPSLDDVMDTFSMIRALARLSGGTIPLANCANVEEAIERIKIEVGDSYPSFQLRGLDWRALCEKHVPLVRASSEPTIAMQEWMAELQDGHSWVRPAVGLTDRPYQLWVTPEEAIFTRIPEDTPAWKAGIRVGFRLIGEDDYGWWKRSAATPYSRAFLTGRRLLQGAPGTTRIFKAVSPQGQQISWDDPVPDDPWRPIATWQRLPSGTGYLKIKAWLEGYDLDEIVDEALSSLKSSKKLIVDLRGNLGGDLILAHSFRNRFLREPGLMGTIRTRLIGSPDLSEPAPILGEPIHTGQRWTKPVIFLTDALTNSASEDALLGLQGLSHVKVVGEPSGGGSGRMRVLRLLSGWRLTVSTALTYDRQGRCIEGNGIPVDYLFSPDPFLSESEGLVLDYADRLL